MSDVTGTGRPRVTRSVEATSAVSVREVARRRLAFPNGWWGMAMLIATEATIFGTLIASYFYLRFQVDDWPPNGIEKPSIAVPFVLTGVLVATSVPVWLGVRMARAGRAGACARLLFLAAFVQTGYLAMQIHEYVDDLHKFSPRETAYGSIYFTLLMTHHIHVLVGILLLGFLILRLGRGLTAYRLTGVRAVGIYWHFVNAAAIAVVFTQLYPSL